VSPGIYAHDGTRMYILVEAMRRNSMPTKQPALERNEIVLFCAIDWVSLSS
jgi:hypothetical protein